MFLEEVHDGQRLLTRDRAEGKFSNNKEHSVYDISPQDFVDFVDSLALKSTMDIF